MHLIWKKCDFQRINWTRKKLISKVGNFKLTLRVGGYAYHFFSLSKYLLDWNAVCVALSFFNLKKWDFIKISNFLVHQGVSDFFFFFFFFFVSDFSSNFVAAPSRFIKCHLKRFLNSRIKMKKFVTPLLKLFFLWCMNILIFFLFHFIRSFLFFSLW